MKKRSVIIAIICIIVIIAAASFFLLTGDKDISNNQLKVGVILPLSGDMAMIGTDMQQGINLATKGSSNIVLNYEDSLGQTKDMVSAYQKMVATFDPDVIIAVGTGVEAIAPLAEQSKIPLIASVSSNSGVPAMGEYIYRYFTNADVDAPVMADYAVNKLGFKKFVVLHLQDQFAIDYGKVFEREIQKSGGSVVANEAFNYGEFDFRTQLTKIKSQDFDAIYVIGLDFQILPALQQIKSMGINKSILSVGTIATSDSIKKAGSSIEGVYVTAFCTDGAPQSYVTEFQNEYNTYPGFFSELGYDIVKIIRIASQKGTDTKQIQKGLSGISEFSGNSGVVSIDRSGEVVIPMCVKQIKGGKIFNTVTGKYSDY